MPEIPFGYCKCGCGQITPIARTTKLKQGIVAGQPTYYLRGHIHKLHSFTMDPPNPSGVCQCGCGQQTSRYIHTDPQRKMVEGQFARFVQGHHAPYVPPMSDIDRFWSKVKIGEPDECWEWQAGHQHHEKWGYYGFFQLHGKTIAAHRASYELNVGPIPDGLWVLHKCDNPLCVNPKHLFLGTCSDNMKDMASKGRTGIKQGSKHANSKLTEEQVVEIRRLLSQKLTQKVIAKRFGVSTCPISNIARGKGWRHVK